jgi:hypothetical protein
VEVAFVCGQQLRAERGLRGVDEGDVRALAAAVAAHEPLKGLRLGDADFRSGLA